MNIASNIAFFARTDPDKTAIEFEGRPLSYLALDSEAGAVGGALQAAGIGRGDRVALWIPNIPEFATAYFGVVKIGAIAVSINTHLKPQEVNYILEDCEAGVLITTAALAKSLGQACARELPKRVVIRDGDYYPDSSWDDFIRSAPAVREAVECEPDEAAAILYTSGTTGTPKGATLSHRNLVSNVNSFNYNCGMTQADRLIAFLPLYHCFGQNAILNGGLNVGATVVLHRQFNLERIARSLINDRISMFFGVPANFIVLHDNLIPEKIDHVRYYFSAAAPLPIKVALAWAEKFGRSVNEGYGLTETSPFAAYNHRHGFKAGSVGSPIENVEMKIVSDQGVSLGANELGEIAIRGPNVMLGYWNRPRETAEVIRGGWFYSGDIGKIDHQGYFYVVDRIKDMINVGGMKVFPAEVEYILMSHPDVAECAVFGVTDPVMGERVIAHVIARRGNPLLPEELSALAKEKLADYKTPSEIELVETIPRSKTGKVLKRLLRDEYAAVQTESLMV